MAELMIMTYITKIAIDHGSIEGANRTGFVVDHINM
jgi:hypothetical protein